MSSPSDDYYQRLREIKAHEAEAKKTQKNAPANVTGKKTESDEDPEPPWVPDCDTDIDRHGHRTHQEWV